jgi:hypothetical protein
MEEARRRLRVFTDYRHSDHRRPIDDVGAERCQVDVDILLLYSTPPAGKGHAFSKIRKVRILLAVAVLRSAKRHRD